MRREQHTLSTAPGDWQKWKERAEARGLSVAEYLRLAEEALDLALSFVGAAGVGNVLEFYERGSANLNALQASVGHAREDSPQ